MKLRQITKIAAAATLALGVAQMVHATDEAFDATITLVAPIVITETKGLDFKDATFGSNSTVVTASADPEAAIFAVQGEANAQIAASVVETSIEMITGTGAATSERITVDSFSLGGDLIGGVATLDGSGQLNDLRVGGSAHVEAEDIAGTYVGTATFRVTYN